MDKNSKSLIIRTSIFLLSLLILVFTLIIPFIKAPDFAFQLRNAFLLQKMMKIISLIVILFIFLSFNKIKKIKMNSLISKESLIVFFIAILFFIASFATQGNIDKILNEGVSVEKDNVVNFDSSRWLSIGVLSDKNIRKNVLPDIEFSNDYFKKIAYLDKIPENAQIVWHGMWMPGSSENESCSILMKINNHSYDVSDEFLKLEKMNTDWMSLDIKISDLQIGANEMIVQKECGVLIALSTQEVYTNHNSFIKYNGRENVEPFNEFVWFIKTENESWFSVLFKLGFIFRILAIISLFIAIFGIKTTKEIVKKAKIELLFSTVFAYLMYIFAIWIQNQWIYLSKIVTYSVYFLLKITFLNPTVGFLNPALPKLGIGNFIVFIADTCSGVEGIGYFLIAYTLLIIFNWRKINHIKALFMYIPGIIGVFVFNIIRVYLILIVGAFISREFALNSFHTNIGIITFIIYFLIFWPLTGKYLMKESKQVKD